MASNMVKAQIKEDTMSILKNPAMGWALYIDTVGGRIDIGDYIPEAEFYWESVENAVPYVSHLYLRVAWAELEPQKGRYAWVYDSNFKKLIQGARDRGIKLCFSIYYLSKDAAVQATPARAHCDYIALPYTPSEVAELARKSAEQGILPMHMWGFSHMWDIAVNPVYGNEAYAASFNAPAPVKGAYIGT